MNLVSFNNFNSKTFSLGKTYSYLDTMVYCIEIAIYNSRLNIFTKKKKSKL